MLFCLLSALLFCNVLHSRVARWQICCAIKFVSFCVDLSGVDYHIIDSLLIMNTIESGVKYVLVQDLAAYANDGAKWNAIRGLCRYFQLVIPGLIKTRPQIEVVQIKH
jgi:hypothetical protein